MTMNEHTHKAAHDGETTENTPIADNTAAIDNTTADSPPTTHYVLLATLSVRSERFANEEKLPPFVAGVYSSLDKTIAGIDQLNKSLSEYCRERFVIGVYRVDVDILQFNIDKDFPKPDWHNFIG